MPPVTASKTPQGSPVVNIGTRESILAMAQARMIAATLQGKFPEHSFPIHGVTSIGDQRKDIALSKLGGKALWTSHLEEKLLNKELDIVVHCLKDMPTTLPEGCVIGCITAREDPRDVLIIKKELADKNGWKTLEDLPEGSTIGTSSPRRIAQLMHRYPHLKFKDHRGNIDTRLQKLEDDPEVTAIILAAAGLQRLDLGNHISQFLEADNGGILYAVGQGALAIECREGDEEVIQLLKTLEDEQVLLACRAERRVMRKLEGGCSVPIGVEAKWEGEKLRLRAAVVALDGTESIDTEATESVSTVVEAEELGERVALDLVSKGAGRILDAITAARQVAGTTR
ncbi:hypothetical protein ACJ41O_012298 [Fusarium nematophilum]